MPDAWKKLDRLLQKYKFDLVRDSTHLIYRYPKTGELLTVSRTPSDWRAGRKALSELRRILEGRHADSPKPLIDHERLEADKLLRSYDPRALPAARKGKATKGIGFKFLHKSVKALDPEQKAVSHAASLAAKAKEENVRNRRRLEREFVAQCVRHVLHETEQAIAWHRRKHEYIIENFRRAWKLLQGLGSPDFDRKRAAMTVQDRGTVDFVILALGRFSQTQRVSERDAMAIVIVSMRFYARKYIHYRRVAEARARQYANGWIAGEPLELNKMKQEITPSRDPFGELFADSILDGIASWHRGMAIVRAEVNPSSNVLLSEFFKAA